MKEEKSFFFSFLIFNNTSSIWSHVRLFTRCVVRLSSLFHVATHNVTWGKIQSSSRYQAALWMNTVCMDGGILRENIVYSACLLWCLMIIPQQYHTIRRYRCYYKNENYVIFSVEYRYGWFSFSQRLLGQKLEALFNPNKYI